MLWGYRNKAVTKRGDFLEQQLPNSVPSTNAKQSEGLAKCGEPSSWGAKVVVQGCLLKASDAPGGGVPPPHPWDPG